MNKIALAVMAVLAVGCADDTAPVEPGESHVWGEWSTVFYEIVDDCGGLAAIDIIIEMESGEVTRWAQHQSYTSDVLLTETGARVILETTFGPRETMLLELVDDGSSDTAEMTVTWTGYVLDQECSVGPTTLIAERRR